MKVLLSIKPQFAKKIFDGSKCYEFRKNIFKNKDVKTVIVYASSPISKIIGEFEIEDIIKDKIDQLWLLTKDLSGIDEEFYYKYFSNKEEGYAIKIKKVKLYDRYYDIYDKFQVKPPQSFLYVKGT